MIKEDYCSYEVAKLLKEKGFDEGCRSYFINDFGDYRRCAVEITDKNCTIEQILKPTLQMIMKWLREEKNIMVSPYALSLGYYFEIFDLTNRDITGCKSLYKVGIPNKKDVLGTYEEACEVAIKYCLEHLI